MIKKLRSSVASTLCELVNGLRGFFYRAVSSNKVIGSPKRRQPIQCNGLGTIKIGENVTIGFHPSPHFFSSYAYLEARAASSFISIGSETSINNNFCAVAEYTSISIGEHCLIGSNVGIFDSDFHGLKPEDRKSRPEWAGPVKVGNRVFLGSNVKILKGVNIGDGAVIANGSLVVQDIPGRVVAGGNPAKVIRPIE